MSAQHAVGYSKSVRAKCHGPMPCTNSLIRVGTLRYGRVVTSELGEQVEWRHWGCVTSQILNELATVTVNNIVDFKKLKPSDQQKIRIALSLRRIDPSDIPPTARARGATLPDASQAPSETSSLKRKADAPPGGTTALQSTTATRGFVEQEEEILAQEEEVRDELYCVLATNVVGIQHYSGLAGPGEQVILRRQPQNPYDRNAIQVMNHRNIQVGHLPATVSLKLAPLLDKKLVTVEGVINDGNLRGGKAWKLSISVKFYGPADKRSTLEPMLIWATPGQRGFPARNAASTPEIIGGARYASTSMAPAPVPARGISSNIAGPGQQQRAQTAAHQLALKKQQESLRRAAELKSMLETLEKVDDEGRRNSLLDTVCSKDDILNLPLHPNPPGIQSGELKVDLLKHQSQALRWCIERETPQLPKKETDLPVQFWQFRKSGNKSFYLNVATKSPQEAPPALGKGALCADAMGLGKTLTMLSLILATKNDNHPNFSKTTLIVAPVSILSNWEKQIEDHCVSGAVSYYIYYGNSRTISADDLKKYDVVITTYQTVVGEANEAAPTAGSSKKKKLSERSLFEVPWKRIILDEGHVIRNPKTKMAKAVIALNGDRRWVLSGTPIINSPRDLGSMLSFLRICQPLDNEDYFKRLLIRPLKNGDPEGAELLKALMSHICLRRTKEMHDSQGVPLIALPPVEMIRIPVTLDEGARKMYDEIQELSQQRVENMMASSAASVVQSSVLSMLTRMRQMALHPALVPARYLEELRGGGDADSPTDAARALTPEEKQRLQRLLAQKIEDCEECPICLDVLPDDARITPCTHVFCIRCITETLNKDTRCPMDRNTLTLGDLYERPPPTDLTQMPIRDMNDELEGSPSSAKIDQLVQLLRIIPKGDKALVFSQFTSFLDKIQETFDEEGISFVRFDGQMSAKRRQEAIARFSVPLSQTAGAPSASQATQAPAPATQSTQGKRPVRATRPARSVAVPQDAGSDSDDEYNPFGEAATSEAGPDPDVESEPEPEYVTRDSSDNPRVMLISLKAGALGLNLTVANHVYLMDPWWQEGIESQAVDRVNRIGQTKPVHVYQLIAEDTVESKVLEIQDKKNGLIKQAFAGIKSNETQRQQRESRLQDLVRLFGIRRQVEEALDGESP